MCASSATHVGRRAGAVDRGDWINGDGRGGGKGAEPTAFTPAEQRLATSMGAMWARVAAGGAPLPLAAWPAYANASERQVVLAVAEDGSVQQQQEQGLAFRVEAPPRARYCDFWARVQQRQR